MRDPKDKGATKAVAAVKAQWAAQTALLTVRGNYINELAKNLKLVGEDSRLRWLAYKPPE